MPSSIPYDPSLTLGNVIPLEKLSILEQIADLQAKVDASEDRMNSLIALKNSLNNTKEELIALKVDSADVVKKSKEVGEQIAIAVKEYGETKMQVEEQIQPLKAEIRMVSKVIESPIDYNKMELKSLPLAAKSIKMNCQYFTFDKNQQTSNSYAANISSFVSNSFNAGGFWGSTSGSSEVKNSVQQQVSSQHQHHSITGTLVISINCTHPNVNVIAPFILNPDKAIRVWNHLYPDDMIRTNNVGDIAKIMQQEGTPNERSFNILSGVSYGSSFVGMVHILEVEETQSTQRMTSMASSVQAQFEKGAWIAKMQGGFGVDSSFTNSVKQMLSTATISSHCTLTVMGMIPSLKANDVKYAVKQFAQLDGESEMQKIAQLQNANSDSMQTMATGAEAARTGAQMIALENAKITSALSALSDIEREANKVINTNSLMEAMEDYLNECKEAETGIPLNYYIKPITKSQLARLWLAKYFPQRENLIGAGDDTERETPAA